MRTRCKDGDLAIIIKDEPGCEANLGRFMRVHGPKEVHAVLGPVWPTMPVTGAPVPFRNPFGRVEPANRLHSIRRPDAWLLPIRARKSRAKPKARKEDQKGRSRK